MNITLGVPRIRELINARYTVSLSLFPDIFFSDDINTPLINVVLEDPTDENLAFKVKGLVEKVELGSIATSIDEVHSHNSFTPLIF